MGAVRGEPRLRITVVEESPEQAVLRLEGWVSGEGVGVLEAEGRMRLDRRQTLVLDLDGVHFIDEAGLDLLEGWAAGRLELRGGSLFIRTQLAGRGLAEGNQEGG